MWLPAVALYFLLAAANGMSLALAKVDGREGRRVVHEIPPEAVRPARLLVNEAIGIVGRNAVVLPATAQGS